MNKTIAFLTGWAADIRASSGTSVDADSLEEAATIISTQADEITRLRQLLSEAEKRERETLTQISELAETAASDLVEKWKSDLGATADTKAAGVASHIVNDFRGHIEGALIKLERQAALERSQG